MGDMILGHILFGGGRGALLICPPSPIGRRRYRR